MAATETVFHLPHQNIAAKLWNAPTGIPTLALHGWLDNAASFDGLAPLLPHAHIIAIDLPGHGHSDHKPHGTFIHFMDLVIDTIQIANALGYKKFALLGHSLGAAIASFVAGTFPERILGMALIDGLGPFTTPASQAPARLRTFIAEITAKPNKQPTRYPNVEAALAARLAVNQIQADALRPMIERGLKPLKNGEWTWRTDPRLMLPAAIQLTEDQVLAFLREITAPVCIIRPEPGYAFPEKLVHDRLNALKQITVLKIPGHHHVHLDDPQNVAKHLAPFFAGLERKI